MLILIYLPGNFGLKQTFHILLGYMNSSQIAKCIMYTNIKIMLGEPSKLRRTDTRKYPPRCFLIERYNLKSRPGDEAIIIPTMHQKIVMHSQTRKHRGCGCLGGS